MASPLPQPPPKHWRVGRPTGYVSDGAAQAGDRQHGGQLLASEGQLDDADGGGARHGEAQQRAAVRGERRQPAGRAPPGVGLGVDGGRMGVGFGRDRKTEWGFKGGPVTCGRFKQGMFRTLHKFVINSTALRTQTQQGNAEGRVATAGFVRLGLKTPAC